MADNKDGKPSAADLQSKYGIDFGKSSLFDQAAAPGDDSVQPTTSPIDLAAGAVGSKLAGPVADGLSALAADEHGVVNMGKMVRSGENGFAPIEGEGLASKIPQGMTPDQTQAYLTNLYNQVQAGQLDPDLYHRIFSSLNKTKNYADGGPVAGGGPLMLPDAPQESTQASFDQAFAQPTTPIQGPAPAAQALPATPSGPVNVLNPSGELVSIAPEQIQDALGAGYSLATPEHVAQHVKEQKYGGLGQQVIAGLEGAAEANTFGLSTGVEKAFGVKDEDIQGRKEVGYGHTTGEIAGLGLSALTGVGEIAALERVGALGAKAVGLGAPLSTVAKIGSAAVKAAIENAGFTAGSEVSNILSDPDASVAHAAIDIGLSGLIGAGFGGALGSVSPLWEVAKGKQANSLLGAVASKAGGIEGHSFAPGTSQVVQDALVATGADKKFAPEIIAAVSDNPDIRSAVSTVIQRDTTSAGPQLREAMTGAREHLASVQAEALGTKLADVPSKGEIDKYATGKSIGDTLAKEYEDKVAPLAKEYEAHAAAFKGKDLEPSIADKAEAVDKLSDKAFGQLKKAERKLSQALKAENPGAAIEAEAALRDAQNNLSKINTAATSAGTVDTLQQRLANLITREKWGLNPDSDIMRAMGRVQKNLPNVKTLDDLNAFIKQVGDDMKSQHPFGLADPMSRAGGMVKGILRDAESEAIESHLSGDALTAYRATQQKFAAAAKLKEGIEATLGAKGSVTNYGKSIKALASENGEKVLRALSGSGDASWLEFVQQHFPETSEIIKKYHIDSVLAAAKDGESLSSKKLTTALDKLSPQVRNFALTQEQQATVASAHGLIEKLNDKTYNWSNTARTQDKLSNYSIPAAIALVSELTGHGFATSLLLGQASHILGKTIPDHTRLALLKFLGSTNKVDGGAFKVAADYISRVGKGESLVTKATQNVFKDGADVLPDSKRPTEAVLDRLDKKLQKLQADPSPLLEGGGKIGHYLPEQVGAIGETNARVVNYVNSQRPTGQKLSPLDPVMPPSEIEKAAFTKVLEIAQQPLVVVEKIKDGSLLPDDVIHLQAMYPKMYDTLVQKLTNAMTEHLAADGEVPYHTRMSLSLFTAQPLDATMTPEAIISAQPRPAAQPQQGQMTQPKHSTAKLGKLPNNYLTATQSAEKNNQPKK